MNPETAKPEDRQGNDDSIAIRLPKQQYSAKTDAEGF